MSLCYRDKYNLNMVCKTKKVAPFFSLKDKNLHLTFKIFHRICYCEEDYVGESKRKVPIR